MMIRICMIAALLVSVTFSVSSAEVTLTRKIVPGRKSVTTVDTVVKQTMQIAGMDIETGSTVKAVTSSVNGKPMEDGSIQVKSTIDSLTSSMSLPGGVTLEFDSNKPVEPAGTQFDMFLDLLKATATGSWTTEFDKSGKVTAVKGRDAGIAKLDENLQKMVKGQFDPEYLVKAANQELDQIPSKPLAVGETWKQTQVARLEGAQTMTLEKEFTYKGTVEEDGRKLDKIEIKTLKVDITTGADAPAKIAKCDLKVEESQGELLFDRELGEVVKTSEKNRFKGSIALDIQGMELDAKLDLTMKVSRATKIK